MGCFTKKNLNLLKDLVIRFEEKRKQWNDISYTDDEIWETEDLLYMKEEGKVYQLYSRDLNQEISYYLQGVDFQKDNLFIVFGMGNLALLQHMVDHMTEDSRILIIEPNAKVFKYCLNEKNLAPIFDCKHVCLCVEDTLTEALQEELTFYMRMGWNNLVYNMHILVNPNYERRKQEIYEMVAHIRHKLFESIVILGNCLEDAFNGFAHSYLNVDGFMTSNSIREIQGKYKGYPGIIVASGPSLEKNIGELSKANGKALIIACDASLDACKKYGVEVDAIASIERDEPTYTYYYKGKDFDSDLVMLGPTVLWPKIMEEYKGKKIIMAKTGIGPEGFVNHFFENIEPNNLGMSCATLAFRTAMLAGCDPIILVGQDLAFTDDKKHSASTHVELEGDNDAQEHDGTMVEDIYGNMIKTDTVYNLFRIWFEERALEKSVKVIDATEGGAKIKGSEIITLKEAIDTYCTKEKPKKMYDYLSDVKVTPDQYQAKYREMIDGVTEEQKKIEGIRSKAMEHYFLLEELYDRLMEDPKEEELIQIVRRMERGNQIIADVEAETSLNTLFRPIIKQTITHVKALGNALTSENVLKNLKLQGNLMGMLMRSCDVCREEYQKMTDFLEGKLEA